MTLKLSRADTLRDAALRQIDAHFADLINAEMGPLGMLHALKRTQALGAGGRLVEEDADAVVARAKEQDERLASLDKRRRDLKQQVQTATSAAEIKSILAGLTA